MENSPKNKYPPVGAMSDRERVVMVKEIFSTITGSYDFLNHFLSFRRDVAWRRFTIRKMHFTRTGKLLDVACGTGDLSIGAALYYSSIMIAGIDFVAEMVQAGNNKTAKTGLSDRITLLQSDARQ